MGALEERVKLSLLVHGNGIEENFKNNSLEFLPKWSKSDNLFKAINVSDIKKGGFYFFHYKDPSKWMEYSPVFVVDYKKFDNKVIIFGVNLNFIPLQIRSAIFDPYFKDEFFEKDTFLKVTYDGMYKELLKWKFEYSLMEYNAIQIYRCHKIHMSQISRFLYSQHPKAKYDPQKLMQIWNAKLETRDKRHNEMAQALISDFYDVDGKIKSQYDALKGHIQRIKNSLKIF
jgi:hypothetical protein